MGRVFSVQWQSIVAAALATALWSGVHAAAQTPPAEEKMPEEPPTPVLRTYVNLVQVPVLVLLSDRQPKGPVDPSRFRISLDSGPLFAPRHVRREGTDPMRLVILVDENSASQEIVSTLPDALTHLDEKVLLPQDRISLQVTQGCTFTRSSAFFGGPEKLKTVAGTVLQKAQEMHAEKEHERRRCTDRSQLWDSMANAVIGMKDDPGRKVLLVVTDGVDAVSKTTPLQLRELATNHSVTIFAVRRGDVNQRGFTPPNRSAQSFQGIFTLERDPLPFVCELTGGMVLEGHSRPLGTELVDVLSLIRGRYIVDFVRPTALQSGKHSIEVSIGDKQAFIRVGGTSVPLPDPKQLNDPDRLPSDKAAEPPVGTRRILK